jgi:hypothetical protein
MTVIIRGFIGLAIGLSISSAAASPAAGPLRDAPDQPPAPVDVLRQVGLLPAEISAVERGEAVAKLLDTDRRQVAVAGAVRIKGSRERLVARVHSLDYLKRSTAVIDAGVLTNPVGADDFAAMPFEPYDLDLRECRPGDCRVRLSDADILRFQRETDWNSPDWQSKSAAVWREVLLSYVTAYLKGGSKALPVYANKPDRLSVADEQALLLKETAFIHSLAPGLLEHLWHPAARPLPGSERLVYWSKEDFEIRPVLRITYHTVYTAGRPPSPDQPPPVVIGTTQLYSAHYLDAAVSFLIALEPPRADRGNGFYLIAVNRARTRSLGGFFRRFARAAVQKRSREGLEKILRSTKAALEG